MPGAPPPAELQQRLADAAADPATTSYGPIVGDLVLRQALAKDIRRVYEAEEVTEECVNVTAGCNMVRFPFGGSAGVGQRVDFVGLTRSGWVGL